MVRNNRGGCLSRRGTPLRAWHDRAEAVSAAEYATKTYGNAMIPYRCRRCQQWHLCPKARHTPSHDCSWCGKRSYETEAAAERRADILSRERGVALRVYECDHWDGWHLTSKS